VEEPSVISGMQTGNITKRVTGAGEPCRESGKRI